MKKFKHLNVDLTGREVKAGDLISYPTLLGRSAGLSIFRVLEISRPICPFSGELRVDYGREYPYKMKVQMLLTNSFGVNKKTSTLQYPERAVILGPEFEALVSGL